MFKHAHSKLKTLAKSPKFAKLSGFARDKDGVAAIEFALIAPVMLAMYFGLAEVTVAITKDREVSHSAAVVGDLTTRLSEVNENSMADIMTAALAVLGIDSGELRDLSLEVISYELTKDSNNQPKVEQIGYARLGTPLQDQNQLIQGSDLIEKNLISENSGAVITRINYRYKPVSIRFMKNVVFTESVVQKPRGETTTIPFTSNHDSYTCSVKPTLKVTCS